jgi:hypothetical protein
MTTKTGFASVELDKPGRGRIYDSIIETTLSPVLSRGAAIWAVLQIAKRPEIAGKRVIAVVPGFAERYVSTVLFEGL